MKILHAPPSNKNPLINCPPHDMNDKLALTIILAMSVLNLSRSTIEN